MKKGFNLFVLLGLVLGILGGLFLPGFMNSLSFIGTIYINLLKFMIIPIVFTSIMVTIYKSHKEKTKILGKTIITFIIMFIITFLLTSLIVYLLKPGASFNFSIVDWNGETSKFSLTDTIINLFPTNIAVMIQNNAIFPCIIFAFVCGICCSKVEKGERVIEVVEGFKNIFSKILEYIMYLTPIAVFSLIGTTTANYGILIFGVGAKYIGTAYLCSIITMIVVMILPVWIFAKVNPLTYIKKIAKVWLMTITTCSSAATLPCTIKVCNEELKIPEKITNVVVPLGCTIHMCGGAVSFALLGLFCSQLFGIEITLLTYLLMIISATLINMAAPGIPNGGIVIGASYLSMLGIPLTFIGLYSGIYKLLDMSYTTLNVTGDITANVLLSAKEKS